MLIQAKLLVRFNNKKQLIVPESDDTAVDQKKLENFWRWFDGSKLIERNGTPMVLYHGTAEKFDEFHPSTQGIFGPGIYITDKKQYATNFAGGKDAMEVYACIRNPYVYIEKEWQKLTYEQKLKKDKMFYKDGGLIKGGKYDGIIVKWDENSEEMGMWAIPFYPNQIKSATSNNGEFSPSSPKITATINAKARLKLTEPKD